MRVSAQEDFTIVYCLLRHEYLGYLLEAHAVQLGQGGRLTLRHQILSPSNLTEFAAKADETDRKLVALADELNQERIITRCTGKRMKPEEFFLKHFSDANRSHIREHALEGIERVKAQMLPLLADKPFYVMGQDGNPAWQPILVEKEPATIRFHFHRNPDNTHYYPTLRHHGERLEIIHKGAAIICNRPAAVLVQGHLFTIAGQADGKKLLPFLTKKFVAVPRSVEAKYYRNFVAPLIETEDVVANGFTIDRISTPPKPVLLLELQADEQNSLFAADRADEDDADGEVAIAAAPAVVAVPTTWASISLRFAYGVHTVLPGGAVPVSVRSVEREGDFSFIKIERRLTEEQRVADDLAAHGLPLKSGYRAPFTLGQALRWLQTNRAYLDGLGAQIRQNLPSGLRFALEAPRLELAAAERIDWFELSGLVRIGEHTVPFATLRRALARREAWIRLPDGELLPIPQDWADAIEELARTSGGKTANAEEPLHLRPHQMGLLGELAGLAGVSQELPPALASRMEAISQVVESEIPEGFIGQLRPYQKHGYDWLQTMRGAGLGACLADDMGLGKTVQTLALLSAIHEKAGTTKLEARQPSLLVVPNSLLYNWEREARRFAPALRILRHIGQQRRRTTDHFAFYNLIITSYGTLRSDRELFAKVRFAAIVLDEAHAIKNHDSATAKAVFGLQGGFRLSLTGTPIENNLLELWSQMQYLNPGLLGPVTFFREHFAVPIEKQADQARLARLRKIVQPFLLRRLKQQVAKELPDKTVQTVYCEMPEPQRHAYEKVRSAYRQTIFEKIEDGLLARNRFLILRGLTHLRQIACHPALTEPDYMEASGKFESVCYKLQEALEEGHKVLIFSQFTRHLALLKTYLEGQQVPYAYLDGQTKDRAAVVDGFEAEGGPQVFLLSLKAGGVGLNLTSADYVFVLDPWWNPSAEAQAIDRAHRIGQQKAVFVYKFITRDSVEERILELQARKATLAGHIVSGEDAFLAQMTDTDVREIFG